MAAPRILLADDSQLDRELAKEMLPWPVVEATTLAAARDMVTEGAFDVILLDQHFPDGFGTSALEAWRDAGITTPVIGLLGTASEEDRELFYASGANGTVRKEAFIDGALTDLLAELIPEFPEASA